MGATNGFEEEKQLIVDHKKLIKSDAAKWHQYLAKVLSTYEGREWAYTWFHQNLNDCTVFTGDSKTYYLSGWQDVARDMQKHMKAASFDGWVEMEREAQMRKSED